MESENESDDSSIGSEIDAEDNFLQEVVASINYAGSVVGPYSYSNDICIFCNAYSLFCVLIIMKSYNL
jgi:hypothetical protein